MTVVKDKEKPKKLKTLTFRQLLSRVSKHADYPSLLKTAAQSGWLTDGLFLTRLSDKEQDMIREQYRNHQTAKKANPVDLSLPSQVGSMVDHVRMLGKKVRLTANDKQVIVDVDMFLTMKKRHPEANIFLSDNDDDTIIFSEKTTVAVIPVQK